jgi:16S rRNA (uracil1498-N3)-methyltransferase
MKLRRFFIEGDPLNSGERLITGHTARHLNRVLRLGIGERVVLFDGSGYEFPAEILDVKRQEVRLHVEAGLQVDRESSLSLLLGLGLCQPATMDLVIQKATELGVTEIVPLKTERAQLWLTNEKAAGRFGRWERIAQQAARQSGRNRVPLIAPLVEFFDIVDQAGTSGIKLIFWEDKERPSLKQIMESQAHTQQACVLIGPEGGFSAKEVEWAVAAGFQSVSLGRRVLRTETAAIAAVSLLQYELGDFGLSL